MQTLPRSPAVPALRSLFIPRIRIILDVPKPKYCGAPNLCEDLYETGFPSLLKHPTVIFHTKNCHTRDS